MYKSRPAKDPIERFMSHINTEAGLMLGMSTQCWIYTRGAECDNASRTSFNVGNKKIVAIHIFSYETFVGKRKHGEIIYSVCRNKSCVNPEHLVAGTLRDSFGEVYKKYGILYKVCPRCKKELPYTDEFYYPAKNRSVQFVSLCVNCSIKTTIERRNKYWVRTLWNECKRGALSRNLEFDITADDIGELYVKQDGRCYWTGLKLTPSIISRFPSKPSLDRLDNSKGYTKENIVLCCLAINIGRNSSTKSDFEDFILKLKNETSIELWRKS